MSRREAFLLTSRGIAVLLVSWGLAELTYFPEYLFAFFHHASLTSITSENYLRNYYFIYFAFLFIRTVVLFVAANWFYNCGPKVEDFFFPSQQSEATN